MFLCVYLWERGCLCFVWDTDCESPWLMGCRCTQVLWASLQLWVLSQKIIMHGSGLNFINIIFTAFTLTELKSVKKDGQFISLFTLSGSTSIKAERKYIGETNTRCIKLLLITLLGIKLPRLLIWAHSQPRVLLVSYPFQLQMQASQPHFQLKLCTHQLGEFPVKFYHQVL